VPGWIAAEIERFRRDVAPAIGPAEAAEETDVTAPRRGSDPTPSSALAYDLADIRSRVSLYTTVVGRSR